MLRFWVAQVVLSFSPLQFASAKILLEDARGQSERQVFVEMPDLAFSVNALLSAAFLLFFKKN
jgi:hypothetical protein